MKTIERCDMFGEYFAGLDWYEWLIYGVAVAGLIVAIAFLIYIRRIRRILETNRKEREALEKRAQELEKKAAENQIEMKNWVRDPLTGLYPRRFFEAVFELCFIFAYENIFRKSDDKRTRHKTDPAMLAHKTERLKAVNGDEELAPPEEYLDHLTVIMIDIDFFKRVNDTHGHPVGDLVLAAMGKLIKDLGRKGDVSCRWGGEEFVVCIKDDVFGAAAFLRRLRKHLAGMEFNHEGTIFKITISAGVAQLHESNPEETEETLIKAADKGLYKAKQDDRNCWYMRECGGWQKYDQ